MTRTGLNAEQLRVLKASLEGRNIFITGSAGVGKSHLVKYICNELNSRNKRFVLLAPTGVAAVNIGGQTIHRFASLRPNIKTFADYVRTSHYRNRDKWCMVDVIIIDEISMVHPNLFTLLDGIARLYRKNDRPMGGIQLILIGDLFQLPYVPEKDEISKFYIFDTPLWNTLDIVTYQLHQVMRQNDAIFVQALNDLRVGRMTPTLLSVIQQCSSNVKKSDKHYVKLFALNRQKDEDNLSQLQKLQTESKTFVSKDTGDPKYLVGCRAEEKVLLKLNCPVMLLWNLPEHNLCNGSVGYVKQFVLNVPLVHFNNGKEVLVTQQTWEICERVNNIMTTLATRTQIPLCVAYSLSQHKSQGLTLDHLEVDCSGIFATGQLYTALSRASTMDGLVIRNFEWSRMLVDGRIQTFYDQERITSNKQDPAGNNVDTLCEKVQVMTV